MTTPQRQAADVDGGDVTPPTRVTSTTTPPPAPTGRNDNFFTQDQVESARREERDKLNKDKKRLREQNAQLEQQLNELQSWRQQIEDERKAQEDAQAAAARAAEEDELSAKDLVGRRAEELEARLAKQEADFRQKFALLELERKAVQLQGYISSRVAQEQAAKTIAPQFIDYIDGTSEEEVEASIERAKAKTAEILQEVAGQQGAAVPGSPQHGVSLRTGPSDIGSVTESQTDGIDYENMSFQDFMKIRPSLGIASGGSKGIFS